MSVGEVELMLPASSPSQSGTCFCPEEPSFNSKDFVMEADVGHKMENLEFRMIPADGFIAAYLNSDGLKPIWTQKVS